MLLSIELLPGVYRHGTELDSVNRYRDVNFVRWQNGSLRPIGGWVTRKQAAFNGAPRGAIAWADNSNDNRIVAGTFEKLYTINSGGTVVDITPVGFAVGNASAQVNTGYGGSLWGTSTYGTTRPSDGVPERCTTWSLDTWGQYLIACSSDDGKIYEWQLNTSNPATVVANAPTQNKGIIVTDERFIFALGANDNPRNIAWCDRENNTDWTPLTTNQAGDFDLQTAGEIMQGVRVKGKTLILTTTDAHLANYTGPPSVYGFKRLGTSCGAASRNCAIAVDEGAFWMGQNAFFVYNGSAIQKLHCDVSDYIFTDINQSQMSKICAIHNAGFSEAWWFYPSGDSTENNRYCVYDYKEGHWNIGELARTAGFDAGVFSTPIWFDHNGNIYNHESGLSHDSAPYAETGPMMLDVGERLAKVTKVIPDEKIQGEVTLSFKTRLYPNAAETTHGPFEISAPTSVRFQGRQFRMRVDGANYKDWRVGNMRLNIIAGSKR